MEEQAWGLPTLPAHLRVPLMDFVEQGLQNLSPEPGASMLSARGSPVPHKTWPGLVLVPRTYSRMGPPLQEVLAQAVAAHFWGH